MPLSGSPLPRGERTDAEQLPSAIAIPDGYNPRRLPILVAPRDDETAPSWLRRFGHRYGLTARALLRELGIPTSAWSPTRVSAHIAEHSDLIVDTVGLPDERARYLRAGLISEAGRFQMVSAPPFPLRVSASFSAGVRQPRVSRGRPLSSAATASR